MIWLRVLATPGVLIPVICIAGVIAYDLLFSP